MNLTLLTHYIPTPKEDYQLIADLTIPGKEAYCARFGYRHLIHGGPYFDEKLYWAIQRLHLVYDYMFQGVNDVDAVWVLNPASIITNYSKSVTDFVDNEHDFFVTKDCNDINMGSFIVRKSDWTKRYLRYLIDHTKTHSHCWFEQFSVINTYQSSPWKEKIKILDHPSINSYQYFRYKKPPETAGNWKKGHLVLALPGLSFSERINIIGDFISKDNVIY